MQGRIWVGCNSRDMHTMHRIREDMEHRNDRMQSMHEWSRVAQMFDMQHSGWEMHSMFSRKRT